MKKIYLNPKMEVVDLKITQQIMAGSPKLGGTYQEGGVILAPEMDWDEDDEDEY